MPTLISNIRDLICRKTTCYGYFEVKCQNLSLSHSRVLGTKRCKVELIVGDWSLILVTTR